VVESGGVSLRKLLPYATSWFDNVVVADDPGVIADAIERRDHPDTVPSSLGLNAAALRMLREVQRTSALTERSSTLISSIGATPSATATTAIRVRSR
jgi:hypothetical protein